MGFIRINGCNNRFAWLLRYLKRLYQRQAFDNFILYVFHPANFDFPYGFDYGQFNDSKNRNLLLVFQNLHLNGYFSYYGSQT